MEIRSVWSEMFEYNLKSALKLQQELFEAAWSAVDEYVQFGRSVGNCVHVRQSTIMKALFGEHNLTGNEEPTQNLRYSCA